MVAEQLGASQVHSTRISLGDPGSNPACGPASNNIIIMMVPWLSLSDRRGKSMHYPESPKVTKWAPWGIP